LPPRASAAGSRRARHAHYPNSHDFIERELSRPPGFVAGIQVYRTEAAAPAPAEATAMVVPGEL
jgi:hypothetical protein